MSVDTRAMFSALYMCRGRFAAATAVLACLCATALAQPNPRPSVKRLTQASSIAPNRDGTRLFVGGDGFEVWDVSILKLANVLQMPRKEIAELILSPDGTSLVMDIGSGEPLQFWDVATGRRSIAEPVGLDWVKHRETPRFLPDGRILVRHDGPVPFGSDTHPTLTFLDGKTGQVLGEIIGDQTAHDLAVSHDGKRAVSGSTRSYVNESDVLIWNLAGKKLERKIATTRGWAWSIAFTPDDSRVLVGFSEGDPTVFDLATGTEILSLKGTAARTIAISPDGKHALTGSDDEIMRLWSLDTGKLVREMPATGSISMKVGFVNGGRHAVSLGRDGALRLVRLDTGDAVTMLSSRGEWVVFSDDGYFDCSRLGAELVAAVPGSGAFPVDQLALSRNRPDILLTRLGLGTPQLIAHYKSLHERRLRKAKIREQDLDTMFRDAPTSSISVVKQNGARVELEAELAAPTGTLASWQLYVNDVAIHPGAGLALSGPKQHVRATVELTSGSNQIEVVARNARGLDSLHATRTVAVPGRMKGDLYFLGFGVSHYKDKRLELGYADKDALDLGYVFGHANDAYNAYRAIHVKTYVNDQVTVANIRAAKEFFRGAGVNDTVVLFVAGHGAHVGADARYYYLTHETDVTRVAETAADFELVQDLLVGIAPRRKLFLMDTCESGERDTEEADSAAATAGAHGLHARTTRGLFIAKGVANSAAIPRAYLAERDRFIHYDLDRRSGAIVLSSSRGSELSYELEELRNGAFTHAIVAALTTRSGDKNRDGGVSLEELRTYVAETVSSRTSGLQNPVVDRDNPTLAFALPMVEGMTIPPHSSTTSPQRVGKGPRGCSCGVLRSEDATGIAGLIVLVALALRRRRSATMWRHR